MSKTTNLTRTTTRELANRLNSIKDGLELEEQNQSLIDLLTQTRTLDDSAIEILLKKEGAMKAQEEFVYEIENQFLKSQTLQIIRENIEEPSEEWSFLTNQEKNTIYNTIKILKKTELEFRLERADLMIMRKEVIDFVTTRLKKISSDKKPQDIINIIINNYTYIDTLRNLGYERTNDGEFIKYYLDENLLYKYK
jgi:hypothetical protein